MSHYRDAVRRSESQEVRLGWASGANPQQGIEGEYDFEGDCHADSAHVGADAAGRVLGAAGGTVVSLIILLSIMGTLNGCFLTVPRVYFAQATDGLFFRKFADVHPEYDTPGFAILAQGGWSAVLLLTGSYESLMDYALFGIWVFYGLMVAGVIVLRHKRADVPRPYRMWGYPVTLLVFLAITVWFLGNMLVTRPGPAFAGLGLMLTGGLEALRAAAG